MLLAVTLVPGVVGTFGVVYLAAAACWAARCACSRCACGGRPVPPAPRCMFHFSLLYLALLFVAVAVDAAVR